MRAGLSGLSLTSGVYTKRSYTVTMIRSKGPGMSFESKRESKISVSDRHVYFGHRRIIEILYSSVGASGRLVQDFVLELERACRYLTSAVFDLFGAKIGGRGTTVEALRVLTRNYRDSLIEDLRGLK